MHECACFCVFLCFFVRVPACVCECLCVCASVCVRIFVCLLLCLSVSPHSFSLSFSLTRSLSLSIYLSFFPLSLSVLPWLEECRLATFLYVDGIPLARRRLRRLRGPLPHVHDASRRRRLRVIGDATPAGDAGDGAAVPVPLVGLSPPRFSQRGLVPVAYPRHHRGGVSASTAPLRRSENSRPSMW